MAVRGSDGTQYSVPPGGDRLQGEGRVLGKRKKGGGERRKERICSTFWMRREEKWEEKTPVNSRGWEPSPPTSCPWVQRRLPGRQDDDRPLTVGGLDPASACTDRPSRVEQSWKDRRQNPAARSPWAHGDNSTYSVNLVGRQCPGNSQRREDQAR